MTDKRYVVIAGPTGSGKSALALALAEALGGEIIGCDSVQVYRGFDVGSAKPSAAERAEVPHHLIDVCDWRDDYDAARYARDAAAAIAGVRERGRLPLVVGGTGLYLRALLGQGWHTGLPSDADLRAELAELPTDELRARLRRLDPQRATELHPNDRVRLARSLELVTLLGMPLRAAGLDASAPADPAAFVIVLEPPRAELHARIAARTDVMLASGLLDEARGLLAAGVDPDCKPMQSIGYKQAAAFLADALPEAELRDAVVVATRQYAKRQCTWFRRTTTDLRLAAAGEIERAGAAIRAAIGAPPL